MSLLFRFKNYITNNKIIDRGEDLLLAVSGGPDSLTMLDLFTKIKSNLELKLVVFHLNHRFRPEADDDAKFVSKIADSYGLKSVIEEFDVPEYIVKKGLSPEEGAREVRFDLLSKWARKLNINKIVLGHNKDDLVETIFLNMIRGSGLKGLVGIEPVTNYKGLFLVHPLLDIYRKEIEDYCIQNGLNPCRDSTNEHNIYTRNRVRHQLIPLIEEKINSGVKEVMARMAEHLRQEEYFLTELAQKGYNDAIVEQTDDKIILSLSNLQKQHSVLRRRIITRAVKKIQGDSTDFYTAHYQAINKLIAEGKTGNIIQLKGQLQVRRSYNILILETEDNQPVEDFCLTLSVPGKIELNNRQIRAEIISKNSDWKKIAFQKNVCLADMDQIELPLSVRNRRDGDRFVPLGMKGVKKVKDFFIDEKVPVTKRDMIPLVVDNTEKIIWIAGYRTDNRFRITEHTKKLLKLSISSEGI